MQINFDEAKKGQVHRLCSSGQHGPQLRLNAQLLLYPSPNPKRLRLCKCCFSNFVGAGWDSEIIMFLLPVHYLLGVHRNNCRIIIHCLKGD
nr:hypothetical protein Iba_chr04aCG4170 [Ipomoea batatas]GMC81460.1 hypothetical protein Iba_chr04bCG4200 [Ipomoea batatas]GMC83729.1 hypothetical protein Iba_chr04cCG4870 [Ipomoea batatas]GMC87928.1 hypothetical protein Iba_chr04eCG5180 [Ipomoea batatas]GMC89834.1 hypothetical protein Iba_chr04fCG2540 [Ipomoea batatas]